MDLRLTMAMVLLAIAAIFIVEDVRTTADAKDIVAIQEPGKGFRGEVFMCQVCNPDLAFCGNRTDCCVKPNPDHIQACSVSLHGHGACFKTETFDGTFLEVTRGCGKKFAPGHETQTDDQCKKWGKDDTNSVCNCMHSNPDGCNSGLKTTAASILPITAVVLLLKKLVF